MSITGREPMLGGNKRRAFVGYHDSENDFFPVFGSKLTLPPEVLPITLIPWLKSQGVTVIDERDGDEVDWRYVSGHPYANCEHEIIERRILCYVTDTYTDMWLRPVFNLIVPCNHLDCQIPF